MDQVDVKKWGLYVVGSVILYTLVQSVVWKIADPYTSFIAVCIQQIVTHMPTVITAFFDWLQMDIHTFISLVVGSVIVWTIAFYLVRREQKRSDRLKKALLSLRKSEKRREVVTTRDETYGASMRVVESGSPEHIKNVEAGALYADAVRYAKEAGVDLD